MTHFEDIVADNADGNMTIGALNVLRGLADHLGILNLSDDDLRAVDYELMTLPMPGESIFYVWQRRRGTTCY